MTNNIAKLFHISVQALDYAFRARNVNLLTLLHIVFTSSQESVIPEFIVRLGNILQGMVCWQTPRMYSLYSVSVCGLTVALSQNIPLSINAKQKKALLWLLNKNKNLYKLRSSEEKMTAKMHKILKLIKK